MHKKGMAMWEVLIWAIILIIVAVLLIYIFRGLLTDESKIIGDQVSSTGDCDNDFVPNAFDVCCETPSGSKVNTKGCATINGNEETTLKCSERTDKCKPTE